MCNLIDTSSINESVMLEVEIEKVLERKLGVNGTRVGAYSLGVSSVVFIDLDSGYTAAFISDNSRICALVVCTFYCLGYTSTKKLRKT